MATKLRKYFLNNKYFRQKNTYFSDRQFWSTFQIGYWRPVVSV